MLTNEQKQSVREMYYLGWNVEDISDHLNLDECAVLDFVNELEQENH